MPKRTTELIAEPGDRVEVRCNEEGVWHAGILVAIFWCLNEPVSYQVRRHDGEIWNRCRDQVRKPEQP